MTWQDTHAQLRACLRQELRKHWGGIAEIEERVACSSGYLNKLSAGTHEFKLDLFLKTLEALEVDPRVFFSRALGIQPAPEDYLRELEEGRESDRAFARIDRATLELEISEPAAIDPAATADADQVEEFLQCSIREQQRRLRATRKYRSHAFTRAYLEHLDGLRFEDSVLAAKLVEKVAVHLIPALPGPQGDRLALQCMALGIFGSARRAKGHLATSARAFRSALELARRSGQRAAIAGLLRRASYLFKDFGHFDRSLAYLREALEIYVDLNSKAGVAGTLVDRGLMLYQLGDHETAVGVLEQAVQRLVRWRHKVRPGSNPTSQPEVASDDSPSPLSKSIGQRSLFAAFQCLAYAYEELGNLEAAEGRLAQATTFAGLKRGVYWAKLRWLQGTLALKRGAYRRAEALLCSASRVFRTQGHPREEARVTIDWLEVLLAQGRFDDAHELAVSLARLVDSLRQEPRVRLAVVQLVRAGFDRTLNPELLANLRAQQAGRRILRWDAPPQSIKSTPYIH